MSAPVQPTAVPRAAAALVIEEPRPDGMPRLVQLLVVGVIDFYAPEPPTEGDPQ